MLNRESSELHEAFGQEVRGFQQVFLPVRCVMKMFASTFSLEANLKPLGSPWVKQGHGDPSWDVIGPLTSARGL